MRLFSSRWCEGEVLCPHVKCSMFIPLFCSLSQIPFDTRALQGPVIPGHWIQIKTSPMFLWLSVQLPFFSTISPLLPVEPRREENPHRSSALEATNMTSSFWVAASAAENMTSWRSVCSGIKFLQQYHVVFMLLQSIPDHVVHESTLGTKKRKKGGKKQKREDSLPQGST